MTYTTLRDGSIAKENLTALLEFDPASRDYPISTSVKRKPFTKVWDIQEPLLQGKLGACVTFAICNELRAEPVMYQGDAVSYDVAVKMYFHAQRNDNYPGGEYPGARPKSLGTSVLQGCKSAKAQGFIKGYRWAFSMLDLKMGIAYKGPAVVATAWTSRMKLDDSGRITNSKGRIGGYHAYVLYGIDMETKDFLILNSWTNWGDNGTARISFRAMNRLMKDYGHGVFLTDKEITDED